MPETIDWPMHVQAAPSASCSSTSSLPPSSSSSSAAAPPSPTGLTFSGSARSATPSVFWKTWGLEWGTFAAFAALTFLILFGAFLALRHSHAADLPDTHTIFFAGRPIELPVAKALRIIAVIAALLIAVATGLAMESAVAHAGPLLVRAARRHNRHRPHLRPAARLLSLYPARLAAYRRMAAHAGRDRVRSCRAVSACRGRRARAGRALRSAASLPWRGVSIAAGFLLLTLAIHEYVGRFDLLFEHHTIFDGVTYTDAHVTLTGMLFVSGGAGYWAR